MKIIATQKFLRISPRKVRPVVALIRKMSPSRAVEILPYVGKRSAEPLAKVIKMALANAAQRGVATENLSFSEIQIGEGPRLKRGNPVSRGRFHPIKKRMSHIRVVLVTKEEPKVQEVKKEKSDKKEATKKVKAIKTAKKTKKETK